MTGPQIILAFDTSAAHCAAALLWGNLRDGIPVIERVETQTEVMAKGQAERLMPMINELMGRHGVTFADVTGLCVGTGPGNFTGIRIAVSLARGLALGLAVPAIGVTGFEIAAWCASVPCPFLAVIDAPRGQFYVQRIDLSSDAPAMADEVTLAALDLPKVWLSDLTTDQIVSGVAAAGFIQSFSSHQPRPAPFYLRGADASPPSDPPPTILP